MKYWLMKSEPDVYSLADLKRDQRASWDGVRNYQARNYMRDEMQVGDLVLYYHSNAKPSGVVGVARVCREAYPDFTAWDVTSKYYDGRSSKTNPVWMMVDLEYLESFATPISLKQLRDNKNLEGMLVIKKGMRLSVQPVAKQHFQEVLKMANIKSI